MQIHLRTTNDKHTQPLIINGSYWIFAAEFDRQNYRAVAKSLDIRTNSRETNSRFVGRRTIKRPSHEIPSFKTSLYHFLSFVYNFLVFSVETRKLFLYLLSII